MNTPELRDRCARELEARAAEVPRLTAFVGLDGFVDEILHVVDKRTDAETFTRLATIAKMGQRISAAAGQSTNMELVSVMTKLGGNGPIMANALAGFGLRVTYLGNLGYPTMHPVFADFAKKADVHTIAQPGFTDAYEFEDGKLMLGKNQYLKDVNWPNIIERFGQARLAQHLATASLVGFVNWTMLSHMSDIWAHVQEEICPALDGSRRTLFVDLADPEKRTPQDIRRALDLVAGFGKWFDVILGLNEKEAVEIGTVLGIPAHDRSPDGLRDLARRILELVPVSTLVVHPTALALAASGDAVSLVEGPYVARPRITTGAGDHFNSGFCLGRLLGLEDESCLLCGVTTSGFYVRTAASPTVADLVGMMREWPGAE